MRRARVYKRKGSMVIRRTDPQDEVLNRKRQIDTMDPWRGMDKKEEAEREEAAKAYAGENEKHFVDYGTDCIKQSVKAHGIIHQTEKDCYSVYKENEPPSYKDKEAWQSRTVIPKPFQTVQYGAAAIKKAFSPEFLSIENERNKDQANFWQKTMDWHSNKSHADFPIRFMDTTTMALAVGVGMEMIARWVPGKGLEYVLIEPWKIHREQDALSRDSQSGMYWIHQEYLDFFVLKQGEKNGRYFEVDRVKNVTDEDPQNPFMTKEAIAARKKMIYERSNFRKAVLTSEFWGMVLDPDGNMLLPRATFTMAGGRIIQKPKTVPYKHLRWPGVTFSPLPDLLRHGGRGLLEGVLTIWEAMNNMMCLHEDYMQWVVNPNVEINIDGLVDPTDVRQWPGKETATRDTAQGQAVIRPVQRRGRTNEVLAGMQYYDQNYQRGSFVSDSVQGLPGYRKDITFREAAMNLDQALGVFGLMGENIEQGAVDALHAGAEIIRTHASYSDYLEIFGDAELRKLGISPNPDVPNGVTGVPEMEGSFHVSGIQALLRDNETLVNIKDVIIPLSERPRFAPFIKPYQILKAVEKRINIADEGIIPGEDEAIIIAKRMQLAEEKQTDAMEKLQELQEVLGIADLAEKLEGIDAKGIQDLAERIAGLEAGKEQKTAGNEKG